MGRRLTTPNNVIFVSTSDLSCRNAVRRGVRVVAIFAGFIERQTFPPWDGRYGSAVFSHVAVYHRVCGTLAASWFRGRLCSPTVAVPFSVSAYHDDGTLRVDRRRCGRSTNIGGYEGGSSGSALDSRPRRIFAGSRGPRKGDTSAGRPYRGRCVQEPLWCTNKVRSISFRPNVLDTFSSHAVCSGDAGGPVVPDMLQRRIKPRS